MHAHEMILECQSRWRGMIMSKHRFGSYLTALSAATLSLSVMIMPAMAQKL